MCLALCLAAGFNCQMGNVRAASILPAASQEEETAPAMGSAPYFRDDAGTNTQIAEGYLYGYWDRRLCRYDLGTLEETVLYEAASSQHGDFCIWGDYIYFMVIPNVTTLGSIRGYLYRVRCDGSEEAVCLTSVRMPEQTPGGQYYEYYNLDTYDDVLYLMKQYEYNDQLCFRLNRDGSIAHISESETLYGKLPEGYSARWNRSYKSLVTLPYAMRNYGYVFAGDEKGNLVRLDPDSGQMESLSNFNDYIRTITNDSIILVKNDIWYRVPLDDIHRIEKIGEGPSEFAYATWDRDGLYFLLREADTASLLFMDWEGEQTVLREDFERGQYSPVECFDEDHYYYAVEEKGEKVVRRFRLTGEEASEQVAVYSRDPFWDITIGENCECQWADEYTGVRAYYNAAEIHFKEDTGAFGRINDFLDGLYAQDMEALKHYKETVNELVGREDVEGRGAEYVEYSDTYEMCYLDEDYVGIAAYWYEYWKEGNYVMNRHSYYIFDRHTGKRVLITDVVDKSAEEICEIMAPYVEAVTPLGIDDEGWKTAILDEGRFFLSEEGIGLYFDFHEINAYAGQEIIVPYRAFELSGLLSN